MVATLESPRMQLITVAFGHLMVWPFFSKVQESLTIDLRVDDRHARGLAQILPVERDSVQILARIHPQQPADKIDVLLRVRMRFPKMLPKLADHGGRAEGIEIDVTKPCRVGGNFLEVELLSSCFTEDAQRHEQGDRRAVACSVCPGTSGAIFCAASRRSSS